MTESNSHGPTLPKSLNAAKLREYAEYADGHRDEEVVIVAYPDGSGDLETKIETRESYARRDPSDPASGTEVLVVKTGSRVQNRPKPEVVVRAGGKEFGTEILKEADALFWTESSMEKFFWPYYGAMRIYQDLVEELYSYYYDPVAGPRIIAVAHVPPSRPAKITTEQSGLYIGFLDPDRGGELTFKPLPTFIVDDAPRLR